MYYAIVKRKSREILGVFSEEKLIKYINNTFLEDDEYPYEDISEVLTDYENNNWRDGVKVQQVKIFV